MNFTALGAIFVVGFAFGLWIGWKEVEAELNDSIDAISRP